MSHSYEVVSSEEHFTGRVISVRTDMVSMPDGEVSQRDVVVHPGATAVVALDEAGAVLLVRQYRHPTGEYLWELPAGLLDVAGEPAWDSARRELAEEGHLTAESWSTLLDLRTSPGMTDEAVRVYLARGLAEIPRDQRHEAEHEEVEMQREWVPLDVAADRALAGELHNAICIAGLLAAVRARSRGFAGLRPPDAGWPARPTLA